MRDNAEHVAFTQDFINNVYARKDEADWRFIVSRFDVLRTKYPNHVPAPVAGGQLPLALPAPPAPLPPALCTKKSPYFPAPELPPEPLEPSAKRPRWADEGREQALHRDGARGPHRRAGVDLRVRVDRKGN